MTIYTYSLTEAADLLKMHKETLRLKATSGEIPGIPPGAIGQRGWIFTEESLNQVLQNALIVHYNVTRRVALSNDNRKKSCSTNAEIHGGIQSMSAESELESRLAQRLSQKPS